MSTQCKEIERLGAGVRVYPVRTNTGNLLFVLHLENGQRAEVESFLRAHQCSGSVANNLLRRMALLNSAAKSRPEAFLRFAQTGISLSELLRI